MVGCTGIGYYIDPQNSNQYALSMWRDLNFFILFFNSTTNEGEINAGFYYKLDFYSGGGIV